MDNSSNQPGPEKKGSRDKDGFDRVIEILEEYDEGCGSHGTDDHYDCTQGCHTHKQEGDEQ